MREYRPDSWVLCKIGGRGENGTMTVHYRVLGSWYGGFAHGDSWRLSSGMADNVTIDEHGFFVCPQHSGSCYYVHPGQYGMSGYVSGVADSYIERAAESGGQLEFTVMSEEEALHLLNEMVRKNAEEIHIEKSH